MDYLRIAATVAVTLFAALTAGHALLNKRDPRAALGWVAVCVLFPLLGPLLYVLFGFNRINTRARRLGHRWPSILALPHDSIVDLTPETFEDGSIPKEFSELARISDAVARRPLVRGNRVEMLHDGEEAYPEMLLAIRSAVSTVCLATYIFETDPKGREFIDALAAARERGVDVRVLIDGIGELYSFPWASRILRRRGVRVARFLPPRLLPPAFHVNLRNHRKILVVDGEVGFTGGMNIGGRHMAQDPAKRDPVADLHFRLHGPVVHQIEEVFLEDWCFVTGDRRPDLAREPIEAGDAHCRAITDGPNDDLDRLSTILVGAVSAARSRVQIMTPYFLPPRDLIAALQAAALRGVEVSVILPGLSNLPFVHWATRNLLWELLHRGVRVYYQPPPFAHSKLFVVDDHYVQIGSANLDPRSLRLNFELAVEIYDRWFGEIVASYFERTRERSAEVTFRQMEERSLPVRLRDAAVWLFSPYL